MCFYCNCELIVNSEKGEILRDHCNGYYNIKFGNIDYTLAKPHFTRFVAFIESLTDQDILNMTNSWNNKIILRQVNMMGGYSFDLDEFLEFKELLLDAKCFLDFEKEVEQLILSNNI